MEITLTKGEALNTTSNFADLSTMRVKKVDRKHVIVGEFTFFKGFSNDQQCTVLLYKKQGGEYRLTQFKIPVKGCCDFYNDDTFVVPDFQNRCPNCPKQSDKVCPFPAVSFSIIFTLKIISIFLRTNI